MNNSLAPYAMTFVATLIFLAIIGSSFVLYRRLKDRDNERKTVESLLSTDLEFDESKKQVTLFGRWNFFWNETLKSAGVGRYQDEDEQHHAGRDVLIATILIVIIMLFVTRNVILSAAVPVALMFGLAVLARTKANDQSERVDTLLPSFLSSLKAYLQSGRTPEQALIRIADTMPSPLYEDLQVAKRRIESNDTFKEAMEEMSRKTASRQLQFLCSCLIQSSLSGTNVVGQIERIQEVLVARQKNKDETNRSKKSSRPAIMVASLALPLIFVFSYISNPDSKNFWFVDPISWGAIIIALVLYGIGLFRVKREVDKVKNLIN